MDTRGTAYKSASITYELLNPCMIIIGGMIQTSVKINSMFRLPYLFFYFFLVRPTLHCYYCFVGNITHLATLLNRTPYAIVMGSLKGRSAESSTLKGRNTNSHFKRI